MNMKRFFSLLLAFAMALTLFACGKAPEPIASSSAPEASDEAQPHYTGPGPSDMIIYPSLNAVTPNADARKIISEDIDLFGLTDQTMQEDLVRILGEPEEIVPSPLEQWDRETYVYNNMRFTFIKTLNDEPFTQPGLYLAEFTRDDLTYPRGIKLGDSLYDVVAKFPQERDYRSEAMYGDPMDKFTTGFAMLIDHDPLIYDESFEERDYSLLLCCGWWPMVYINFDDDLKVDSVYIFYHGDGLG